MAWKRFVVEMDEHMATVLKNSGQIRVVEMSEEGQPYQFMVGERALYAAIGGFENPVPCTIESELEKDGRRAYGCKLDNGEQRWGYADQFRPYRAA